MTSDGPRAAYDVLVLSELNPDVLVDCGPVRPRFGQVEQRVPYAGLTLGGSGCITAAALAALGRSVTVAGVVGADRTGASVLAALGDLGVGVDGVRVDPDLTTGMTVVLSDDTGDRSLLTHDGAMRAATVADVPATLLDVVSHVHVSSVYLQTGLHAGLTDLLAGVRARGGTTSLDPGWDPADEWAAVAPLLPHLDLLLPNEAEAERIARMLDGADDPGASIASYGPTVVVKRGGAGATAYAGTDRVDHRTQPVVPLDTTGAGDNFDAGFLHGFLAGWPLADCLRAGATTGRRSLQGRGGTGSLTTADQLAAEPAGTPISLTSPPSPTPQEIR